MDLVTSVATSSRPFIPGTTGWTARDLDDPQIAGHWARGNYEIIEGVLTQMPPAYFIGGESLFRLMQIIAAHVGKGAGSFATEVDIVIAEARVVCADSAFLTAADKARQAQATRTAGRADPARTRILIPPTLVIESVSTDHEFHDRTTKRRWYAEFGIPNYWILDAFNRSLQCLILEAGGYRDDVAGRNDQELRPALFSGLIIPLKELWAE